MPSKNLSIRLDLANGGRIGPGKVQLLEAVRDTGSISAAARALGMSYRRAWLLIEDVNSALHRPAVAAATGGRQGGGATLTPVGAEVISLYRAIEDAARVSARGQVSAMEKLCRKAAGAKAARKRRA